MQTIIKHVLLASSLATSVAAHAGDAMTLPLPPWVEARIAFFTGEAGAPYAQAIYQTDYHEKTAYYFVSEINDEPNALYDDQGHLQCRTSGKLVDSRASCPSFIEEPHGMLRIWGPEPRRLERR